MGTRRPLLLATLALLTLIVLWLAATVDRSAMALASSDVPPAPWILGGGSVALPFIAGGTRRRIRTLVARALVPLMVVSFFPFGYAYADRHERLATVADAT